MAARKKAAKKTSRKAPAKASSLRDRLRPPNRDAGSVNFPPTLTVNTAGGLTLNVGGSKANLDQFTGVIVHHHPFRKLFPQGTEAGDGARPICGSVDGEHGKGTPGGNCLGCPFEHANASEELLAAKDFCKTYRLVYLAEPKLGCVVAQVPVMSLSTFGKYITSLELDDVHESEVQTVITAMPLKTRGYGFHFKRGKPTPEAAFDAVVELNQSLVGTESRLLPSASDAAQAQLPAGTPEDDSDW